MIKDLAVELRIRNNQLLQRRRGLSLSQTKLAEAANVRLVDYIGLENLRQSPNVPVNKASRCIASGCGQVLPRRSWYCSVHRGAPRSHRMRWLTEYGKTVETAWSDTAYSLAIFYSVKPGQLFPEAIDAIESPVATRLVDVCDIPELQMPVSEGTLRLAAPASEQYDAAELRGAAIAVLDTLPDRERMVIKARLGFDDDDAKTLEEIALSLGVGKERVRQIEAKAYRKLRHHSRFKRLESFLLTATGD